MIILSRLLARIVGIALMAIVAVAGVVAAIFCLGSGHSTFSLAGLASDIHLPQLRSDVGGFLSQTTSHGAVAVVAALAGAAAVVIGLTLIAGCWLAPRPRRIVLERTDDGTLCSLRRPLARLLADRAEVVPEVSGARVRAHGRRRDDGGRVRVVARAALPADGSQARQAADGAMHPVTDGLPLRLKVRGRRATRHDRREVTA